MSIKSDILAERLEKLRQAFSEQLPARIDTIIRLVEDLSSIPEKSDNLKKLRQNTHSLAGAGGSFGFTRLSDKARELEEYIAPMVEDNTSPDEHGMQEIGCLCNEIMDLANKGVDDIRIFSAQKRAPVKHISSVSQDETNNKTIEADLVYIIDDDQVLAEDLAVRLQQFAFRTKCFPDVVSTEHALAKQLPFVMLVDLGLPDGELSGIHLVERIARDYPEVQVIIVSARSDWQARLASARAGGSAYFAKPIDLRELVDRLDTMRLDYEEEPFRVLIVDDVEVLAKHYSLVLESAGVEVTTVTDVSTMLDEIINKKPELILMDLYMPECTGIEAARVIRQINEYIDVPIVFLSTENEVSHQMEAMRIGGDDFLHKPIRDDYLVAAVTTRAQRFRYLRSVMERDSLTGLINHGILENELEREMLRSKRENKPMVFAMLDLDHFKSVNDQHGHQAGDRVIKAVSRILVQRLRKSDVVGRYGGEEFGVILPGTTAEQAAIVLDGIRESVSSIKYSGCAGDFYVTYSVGIAAFPAHGDVAQIIRAADDALYKAKESGRNCVVCDGQSLDNELAV